MYLQHLSSIQHQIHIDAQGAGAKCAISNLEYGSSVAYRLEHTDEPYTLKLHLFLYIMKAMLVAYMSRITKKPTFCICENKDADQLRGI